MLQQNKMSELAFIKKMNSFEQKHLFSILERIKIKYTKNSNGYFFNLTNVSPETFDKIKETIEIIKKNRAIEKTLVIERENYIENYSKNVQYKITELEKEKRDRIRNIYTIKPFANLYEEKISRVRAPVLSTRTDVFFDNILKRIKSTKKKTLKINKSSNYDSIDCENDEYNDISEYNENENDNEQQIYEENEQPVYEETEQQVYEETEQQVYEEIEETVYEETEEQNYKIKRRFSNNIVLADLVEQMRFYRELLKDKINIKEYNHDILLFEDYT
jgi:hypothetical protein